MKRTIFASLATLTLSAAQAAAQCPTSVGFQNYGYGVQYSGNWDHRPYSSRPCTWNTHPREAHPALRRRASGFYLVGSRNDTYDPYRGFGFGWSDDWRRRLPMH
jgi:hypothetical protein